VSKMEGKTNFLRRLKQFAGLTRLTLSPHLYIFKRVKTPTPSIYALTDA